MLTRERQALIRQRIDGEGRVLAAELARAFAVSEDTIRRDLREMAQAGLCDRVYGGALAPAKVKTLSERMTENLPQKRALGRTAAALLPSNATVFIDAGSTNVAVAEAIASDAALTVVTNAPAVAVALAGRPAVDVVLLGGRVDPEAGAVVGAKAMAELAALSFDACVLGTCGVRDDAGLTTRRYEEAVFKSAIAARSSLVIASVTNEKFCSDARFSVLPFGPRLVLVVEADAPEAALAVARRSARIERCPEGSTS